MFDNTIFNVNGKGAEMLLLALKLVFAQEGPNTTAKAWSYNTKDGFILLWYSEYNTPNKFPVGLSAEEVLPIVSKWLLSTEAKAVERKDMDSNYDHDGDNGDGWRVHRPRSSSQEICAIKPVYLWYGK